MKKKVAMVVIFTFVVFVNLYAKGVNKTVTSEGEMSLKSPTISKASEIFTYINGNTMNNDDTNLNLTSEENVKFMINKMR